MKIFQYILGLIFFCIPFSGEAQEMKLSRQEYIRKYKEIAIRHMKEYRIPASITLAQACLESGDGTSRLATEANNHFGIKCHKDWKGKGIKHDAEKKGECFRSYKHAEESFNDHSSFICNRKRYESLFKLDIMDYKSWAKGLRKAGYATDPIYAERLIKIIDEYKLYRYDDEVFDSEIWGTKKWETKK